MATAIIFIDFQRKNRSDSRTWESFSYFSPHFHNYHHLTVEIFFEMCYNFITEDHSDLS